MQSALGYIPLHPPPLEVGTLCTSEMAGLTWQHVSPPPSAGGWNAVHTRHGSPDPATRLPECCAYQAWQP